jgi:hypothetical protein
MQGTHDPDHEFIPKFFGTAAFYFALIYGSPSALTALPEQI